MNFKLCAGFIIHIVCNSNSCQNLYETRFPVGKDHLNSPIKELVNFCIRAAVSNGWIFDPENLDTFCSECAASTGGQALRLN